MELTIKFDLPKRKGYQAVLEYAPKFTNYVSADPFGQANIIITEKTIQADCDKLPRFWYLVGNLKNTQVFLGGSRIDDLRIQDVIDWAECFNQSYTAKYPKEHCLKSCQRQGWGCKKLCWVCRYHDDNRNNKAWYQIGTFKNGIQQIDKLEILDILKRETEFKLLSMCPKFNFEAAEKAVNVLPNKIDPDIDDLWEIDYLAEPGFRPKAVGVKPKYELISDGIVISEP